MNRALFQLEQHLHLYKRSGAKQHRDKQGRRMRRIVEYLVEKEGIKGLEQIGRKQICRYYRDHSHYSDGNKKHYYYGVNTIWREFLGRCGEPPKFK